MHFMENNNAHLLHENRINDVNPRFEAEAGESITIDDLKFYVSNCDDIRVLSPLRLNGYSITTLLFIKNE